MYTRGATHSDQAHRPPDMIQTLPLLKYSHDCSVYTHYSRISQSRLSRSPDLLHDLAHPHERAPQPVTRAAHLEQRLNRVVGGHADDAPHGVAQPLCAAACRIVRVVDGHKMDLARAHTHPRRVTPVCGGGGVGCGGWGGVGGVVEGARTQEEKESPSPSACAASYRSRSCAYGTRRRQRRGESRPVRPAGGRRRRPHLRELEVVGPAARLGGGRHQPDELARHGHLDTARTTVKVEGEMGKGRSLPPLQWSLL